MRNDDGYHISKNAYYQHQSLFLGTLFGFIDKIFPEILEIPRRKVQTHFGDRLAFLFSSAYFFLSGIIGTASF